MGYILSPARSLRIFRFILVVTCVDGCLLREPWFERMFTIPPQAAQMAELYWMALTRDVPFSKYGEDEATVAAAGTPTTFRVPSERNAFRDDKSLYHKKKHFCHQCELPASKPQSAKLKAGRWQHNDPGVIHVTCSCILGSHSRIMW